MASSSEISEGNDAVISFIGGREYRIAAKATPASSDLDEFTCFGNFPTEIRRMIWQFAIPERIIFGGPLTQAIDDLSPHCSPLFENAPCTSKDARNYLAPPPVAQTCREAQDVYYELAHVNNCYWNRPFGIFYQNWKRNGVHGFEETWFDPASDILCLDSWGNEIDYRKYWRHVSDWKRRPGSEVFDRSLRAVAFSLQGNIQWACAHREHNFMFTEMTDKKLWPRLETFLLWDKTIFLHPRHGVTLPANTLSAQNPVALVNVRDRERIRHFKELYENFSLPSHLSREVAELLSSLLTTEGRNLYIDDLHEQGVDFWARHLHRMDHDTLGKPLPKLSDYQNVGYYKEREIWKGGKLYHLFNRQHPWVRDIVMPRVPQFQMVMAFKLCQASHHPTPQEYQDQAIKLPPRHCDQECPCVHG